MKRILERINKKGINIDQNLWDEAKRLLAVPEEIAASTSSYTKSPEKLLLQRNRIGNMIEQLNTSEKMDSRFRGNDKERIEQIKFHSKVLNKEKSYCVVLPKGYEKAKDDWPVLFLFHGRGRTERSLIDDEKSRNALLKAPFVVVLPDGDDGWYINSPVRLSDKYEDYTEEVIDHADNLYHLNPQRKYRSLSGWSMGGYGCTHFAETHSSQFSVVVPIIALLDFPTGQHYNVPEERFGSDLQVWKRYNPIYKAQKLRNTSILIIAADKAFDRTMNENFSKKLTALGIKHELKMLSGGHSFEVVQEAIPIVIDFVANKFAGKDSNETER